MKTVDINEGFKCFNCQASIKPLNNGSNRNHCPFCLHSMHLDHLPGDRKNNCYGLMKPHSIKYNSKKGYQIIHKCTKCNEVSFNKIAQNCEQPDNFDEILNLFNKGDI